MSGHTKITVIKKLKILYRLFNSASNKIAEIHQNLSYFILWSLTIAVQIQMNTVQ